MEQAKAHLADVKSGFDAGSTSSADVMRVESHLAGAEQLEARAKNLVELLAIGEVGLPFSSSGALGSIDDPNRVAQSHVR